MDTAGVDPIRCRQCGHDVPRLAVCVRCGDPLGEELTADGAATVATGVRRRTSFAAAPWERAAGVSLVSTLFPQLPRADIAIFRAALLAGTIVILVLAAAGLFPVALAAAAVLVPLVVVVYLYDVDVYEDEPIRVVALTMLWGAVAGAVFAWIGATLLPVTPSSVLVPRPEAVVMRTLVLPLLAGGLMVLGPVVLLPYRRFNDVLDGVTFGASSAVAFTGAQTLVTAADLFSGGLRPGGSVVPWILRIFTIGVEMPLIAATAIGGLTGALWLRYRAPVADRSTLGAVGQPIVAALLAAALLAGAAVGIQLLGELATVVWLAILAVLGLVWLRRMIHLGLLQEAAEVRIGPAIECANCGKPTPEHTFCGNCGIALGALPKRAGQPADDPAGDLPS